MGHGSCWAFYIYDRVPVPDQQSSSKPRRPAAKVELPFSYSPDVPMHSWVGRQMKVLSARLAFGFFYSLTNPIWVPTVISGTSEALHSACLCGF